MVIEESTVKECDMLQQALRKENLIMVVVLGLIFILSLVWVGEALTLTIPASLILGCLYRPKMLWLWWIGVSAVIIMVSIVGEAMGWVPEFGSEANPETALSLLFEVPLFMLILVIVPLWLGRLVGGRFSHRHVAI